jgi:membrane protein
MTAATKFARSCFRVFMAAARHFNQSDGWAMSSHAALSSMFAIFPFLIFAASLAGFLGKESSTGDMVELVFEYWPEEIAAPIVREIDIVLNRGNLGFLTAGIGFTLFFASNGVEAVRVALNRAYRDKDDRSILAQRIQSMMFILVTALLILVASVLLVFVPNLTAFAGDGSAALQNMLGSEPLQLAVAFLILMLVVFACHAFLPGKRRPIRSLWPGIALTLGFWIVSAKIFAHYVAAIADYSATYAGLAGIMTAQIFLYMMAVILILGAEINAELEIRNGLSSVDLEQTAA